MNDDGRMEAVVCHVAVRRRLTKAPPGQSADHVTRLEIVRLGTESGLRLAYCNGDRRQVAEEVHGGISSVMQQAYFEFGIREEEWQFAPAEES